MSEPDTLGAVDRRPLERVRLEPSTLAGFVQDHYQRLIRLAGLVTRDVETAEDAVQAALERAWRKRGDVREAGSLKSWLDRIVVREAIRQTRQRSTAASAGPASAARADTTDWVAIPSSLPEPIEVAAMREALGRLSPNHRTVVALHLYAGYSVEETARLVGVPFDTVRSRLRAARERLRHDLAEVDR